MSTITMIHIRSGIDHSFHDRYWQWSNFGATLKTRRAVSRADDHHAPDG
jgi:hypothetical protein